MMSGVHGRRSYARHVQMLAEYDADTTNNRGSKVNMSQAEEEWRRYHCVLHGKVAVAAGARRRGVPTK
jgi:hypothetical protein